MSDPFVIIPPHQSRSEKEMEQVLERIADIISRGKIVVFTDHRQGIVKKVKELLPDLDGDLLAFYSTGKSKYVSLYSKYYVITEEEPE
jgi:bifunctional ADP-heptose synthase (sugar kinase/adenylyltransferase)